MAGIKPKISQESDASSDSDSSEVESIDESSTIESSDEEDSKGDVEIDETDNEDSNKTGDETNFIDSHAAEKNVYSRDESDDEVIGMLKRRSRVNRILDSDDGESSDEEEKIRKSFYEHNPEGDMENIVEEKVFSKATRRSIFGFEPKRESLHIESNNNIEQVDISSSDEDDSDIIISETETEGEEDKFEKIEKKLSSTIRSPLQEIDTNRVVKEEIKSPIKEEEIESPIKKEQNDSSKRVSKSFYDAQIAELEALKNRLNSLEKLERQGGLPDNGAKLRIAIVKVLGQIVEKEASIKNLLVDKDESIKSRISESFKNESEESINDEADHDYLETKDVQPKYTGRVGLKNFTEQKALTVEKLQDIHKELDQRPTDDVVEEPPKYLKVDLMRHQLHALAFMIWREKMKPKGGILADDMGLGKTLTVISLILKQMQIAEEMYENDEEYESEEDENEREKEDEWVSLGHKSLRDGGTLVVCPASLINQWEQEIKTKIKRGALDVNVFHGPNRIYRAKELTKYDVVITTYQIILSEYKNNGCVFGVRWDRIVLDEGHIIRNYRSKQSEAVCTLFGKRRWVLTGTPIQNKEFDIYAAIKFLRCSPFDDLRYWKMWIETKNSSSPRLQALLKSILLRRTKQQLQESGEVQSLPQKIYEQINVVLNREERSIYNQFLALSQKIFAQFLSQHQEKHNNYTYDQGQLNKLHQKFQKIMKVGEEVKAHEILTLLLRLRQICCHAGLVKEAIEKSELQNEGIDHVGASANDSDYDILNKLQSLKLDSENDDTEGAAAIDSANDVFNMDIPSTKMEKMMEKIREMIIDTDEKAIIVSQWVTNLNIIKGMLEIEGVEYCELNGTIPVKFRNDIVVDFNNPRSRKKVMLLSITAGGVGLNLVGANVLFIMDPHWNPQIEQQAQDRIYRFGQQKDCKIIKFICEDTIEEKILNIQTQKMDIAVSTLTGAKKSGSKLTIEDLKDLFGMK